MAFPRGTPLALLTHIAHSPRLNNPQTQGKCPEDCLTAHLAEHGYKDELPQCRIDDSNDSLWSLSKVLVESATGRGGGGGAGPTAAPHPLAAAASSLQRVGPLNGRMKLSSGKCIRLWPARTFQGWYSPRAALSAVRIRTGAQHSLSYIARASYLPKRLAALLEERCSLFDEGAGGQASGALHAAGPCCSGSVLYAPQHAGWPAAVGRAVERSNPLTAQCTCGLWPLLTLQLWRRPAASCYRFQLVLLLTVVAVRHPNTAQAGHPVNAGGGAAATGGDGAAGANPGGNTGRGFEILGFTRAQLAGRTPPSAPGMRPWD